MGCNTSKESSVPQEDNTNEAHDNKENALGTQENKNSENNETPAENHLPNDINETKSPSAKTVVIRPKSTTSVKSTKSTKSSTSDKHSKNSKEKHSASKSREAQLSNGPEEPNGDEAEAATKIQAAFRGHRSRKSMKQPVKEGGQQQLTQEEVERQQMEQEFSADDKELCDAATKIQASFRGHMTRKQEAGKKGDGNGSGQQHGKTPEEEELDIDLSDPDLNKAAVKIQATFRGHMVRKEGELPEENNKVSN